MFALGEALHLLPAGIDHAAVAVGQHVLHGVDFQHATFKQVSAVHIGRMHKGVARHHGDNICLVGHAVYMGGFHFSTQVLGIWHHAHAGCSHGVQVRIQAQFGASRCIEIGQRTAQTVAHAVHCGGLETKVLLLDEWLAGLNPTELATGIELINALRDEGRKIVMVEHVMDAIRSLCDRCVVMASGGKIAEGTPDNVLSDQEVVRAYLGDDSA